MTKTEMSLEEYDSLNVICWKKLKFSYYNEKKKPCEDDPKKLYSSLSKPLGRKTADEKLPLASDDFSLVNDLKDFFYKKDFGFK